LVYFFLVKYSSFSLSPPSFIASFSFFFANQVSSLLSPSFLSSLAMHRVFPFFNPLPNLFNVLFFLGKLKSNCYYLFFHFKLTFFYLFACFLFFSCKTNKLTFSKAYLKLHIMPSFFVFKKLKYFNFAFFWMIYLISLISCFFTFFLLHHIFLNCFWR